MIFKELITYKGIKDSLTKEQKEEFKKEKIMWIFSSVFMSIIPFVFVILGGILSLKFDLINLIGNGELILASFTMLPSLIIDFYKERSNNNNANILTLFIVSIVMAFCHVYFFTHIKMGEDTNFSMVILTSLVLFVVTIIFTNYSKSNLIILEINSRKSGDKHEGNN